MRCLDADVAAIDSGGIRHAQIFVGRKSLVVDIYGLKKQSHFVNSLLDNIRQRGAMDTLISDSSALEISQRVMDVLRHLMIGSWQSTPYMQQQNFAERRWKDIKRLTNWIMGYKGVPADCWLLALEYVADVMNLTAVESLNWRTPLECLTGQTPDTSILLLFVFFDKVYYTPDGKPSFPSGTTEEKGRMVGFSKNVGHAMTFKVLTDDTRKVLHKCLIRRIDEPNRRLDPDPPTPYPAIIRSLSDDAVPEGSDDLPTLPTLSEIDSDAIFEKADRERLKSSRSHGEQENGESDDVPELMPRSNDDLELDPPQVDLKRTVLMPPKEDGQRFRAQIIERVQEYHKNLDKARQANPKYRVLVGHDDGEKWEEIVAYNDLMNLITDNDSVDGVWNFRKIKSHQGPLLPSDKRYKGSRWNVLVEWETGECSLEPLHALQQQKALCGLYAREHGLLEEPGWKQFKKYAKRTKVLTRLVNQAKLHSYRTAPFYQHGYLVPRNHDQAMDLDAKNNNTFWADSELLELSQIIDYNTFRDQGLHMPGPADHKKITVHFAYAVKHDGRHKARLVAGGHLTETPLDSVYSSVATIRGIRMIMFLAELNGLQTWNTDIGNAYLESYTQEKIYIVAGKEFACVGLEGHTLIVNRALYGLKSSGLRWHELFSDVMRQMGFFPSKADHDIWMKDMGDHYDYIVAYVDDLLVASKNPSAYTDELQQRFGFKLKGTGPASYHLGVDYFRDADGVLCMAPKKYVDKLIDAYVRMFGTKPKQVGSPLENGDHPEMDDSIELEIDDIKKFQTMIGSLQWVVQIGRFDITTAVMTLSSFRANPRQGHLDRVKRIYGYLYKMRNATIRIRTEEPDYSELPEKIYDWEQSVYAGAEELMPHDAPAPLGKPVVMTTYVDANLYHDLTNGKSVTGVLHLFNKTVIDWYSKKQSTVETATYGAEFVAARTAMEQIIDLRIELRYLGVHVKGSTMMFGDNESVVNSSSMPHARLHKRHNALSFHKVREGIAASIAKFHHVRSGDNPADLLSKQWGHKTAWPTLQPLLFWEGDTMDLVPDDSHDSTSSNERGVKEVSFSED